MKYLTCMEPSTAYFIVPVLSHLVTLCFRSSTNLAPCVCWQIFESQFSACLSFRQGLFVNPGCCFAHFWIQDPLHLCYCWWEGSQAPDTLFYYLWCFYCFRACFQHCCKSQAIVRVILKVLTHLSYLFTKYGDWMNQASLINLASSLEASSKDCWLASWLEFLWEYPWKTVTGAVVCSVPIYLCWISYHL